MFKEDNHNTNIKLVEGDEILNDDEKIAKELKFFSKIFLKFRYTRKLLIYPKTIIIFADLVQKTIAKYEHHSNVLLIQSKISNRYKFFFSPVIEIEVER